jgi:4a-hydroxytetrahydrobiopterin dehydratase
MGLCRIGGDVALLSEAEMTRALQDLPGWVRRENRIEKEFAFPSFPDAVAFLVRLAFDAEAADHHPDIVVHYRRVTLAYWTHTEGGVTLKDLAAARNADDAGASAHRA